MKGKFCFFKKDKYQKLVKKAKTTIDKELDILNMIKRARNAKEYVMNIDSDELQERVKLATPMEKKE